MEIFSKKIISRKIRKNQVGNTDRYLLSGLLNKQLCWYLTCERHQQFDGETTDGVGLNSKRGFFDAYLILAVLSSILALVLMVLYYAMWLCFR